MLMMHRKMGEQKMQLHTMWIPKFSNLQLVKKDNIQRKYFKIVYDSFTGK